MPQDESQVFRAELPPEGFVLESGEALPELHIRYETYGTLNEAASNTVWICSPLTADAHAAGLGGWWEDLIGPGRAIDTDHFFVVSSNILAGCQGTTGPNSEDPRTGEPYGDNFPNITIGDMVAAQKWLADFLGVTRLYAVIGGSMGGFQALKWAINYPSFVERCVVIASGARLSAQALGFDIVERSVILDDAERGLANARKLAHITWAMDHFDLALEYGSLEKAFEKVSAEFLCVHISSDWLFPPAETQVISNTLLNMGKVASSVQINTPMGHDGFLTSTQDLSATV
jgi:homoserine O-acetyltransferase